MALRHRQEGGYQLPHDEGLLYTVIGLGCVFMFAKFLWLPLFASFGFVFPLEVRTILIGIGMLLYLSQSIIRVSQGKECAQLWMGRYTGISYPAGIWFLPALPFPIVTLVCKQVFSADINAYLWWTLEGDVTLSSLFATTQAEGMTQDGVRVVAHVTLRFEVVQAATFLSQTKDGTETEQLILGVSQMVSASLKRSLIAAYTTVEHLQQAGCDDDNWLIDRLNESCHFEREFGVQVYSVSVTKVEIQNKQIEAAFDIDKSALLLSRISSRYAEDFAVFYAKMPEGTDVSIALSHFNAQRQQAGLPPVTMNMVQLK